MNITSWYRPLKGPILNKPVEDAARLRQNLHAYAVLLCLALILTGCVSESWRVEVAGKELYHHNWWNYYERGRELLSEGNVAEAMADFETSLGLRPGAKYGFPREMWRARTYGLHFVEGYFPHRELGITYYLQGRIEDAVKYLEISLNQQPSGRGKHYLNSARKKGLTNRRVPAPVIHLGPECETLWTADRVRRLSGVAVGEGFVRDVRINGEPLFLELAEDAVPFSKQMPLEPGRNTITITAKDLAGQLTSQRVLWISDRQPPRFTVLRIGSEKNQWVIEGICSDDHAIKSVTIDNIPVIDGSRDQAKRVSAFRARLPKGLMPLFVAEDMAGNRLETVLTPDIPAQALQASRPLYELTWLDNDRGIPDTGVHFMDLAAAGAPPMASVDTLKPSLRLGSIRPFTEVFAEEFYLDGEACDGGGLAEISLNGEDLLATGSRGALRGYFARRLSLDLGTNRFEIAAVDTSGNRESKSLVVVRRQPEYLDDEYRLTVGVPPLRPEGDAGICRRIKFAVEDEILRAPVRFHLLERDEGWDFILREQGLSLTDLADPGAALQIGKMLPAEILLMGTLMRDAGGMTTYMKAVETGNGRILLSEDVYCEAGGEDLEYQVSGLVMKIEQHFPLITGEILAITGGSARISVGAQKGVSSGTKFIVVSKSPEDADIRAGSVCKVDGNLVQLNVRRAGRDSGTAVITPPSGEHAVKEGDHVYAR